MINTTTSITPHHTQAIVKFWSLDLVLKQHWYVDLWLFLKSLERQALHSKLTFKPSFKLSLLFVAWILRQQFTIVFWVSHSGKDCCYGFSRMDIYVLMGFKMCPRISVRGCVLLSVRWLIGRSDHNTFIPTQWNWAKLVRITNYLPNSLKFQTCENVLWIVPKWLIQTHHCLTGLVLSVYYIIIAFISTTLNCQLPIASSPICPPLPLSIPHCQLPIASTTTLKCAS